jgi:hypothetical protein
VGPELGYEYGERWTMGPFGIELPLRADLIYIEFAQSYSKTVLLWTLRDLLRLVH